MMADIAWPLACLFCFIAGGCAGTLIAALCAAASRADQQAQYYRERRARP